MIWLRIGGVVLSVVGLLWIGQGLGAIHGSFMTGRPLWAVLGVVALAAGVVLIGKAAAIRRRSAESDD